jgi:DNA-binding XRE family transcriptional regulator
MRYRWPNIAMRATVKGHAKGRYSDEQLRELKHIRAERVERAGGESAVETGKRELIAEVIGYRLAEIRRARGMIQQQVADKMAVTKGRVSQIEQGKVSGHNVLARARQPSAGYCTTHLLRRRRHQRHRPSFGVPRSGQPASPIQRCRRCRSS